MSTNRLSLVPDGTRVLSEDERASHMRQAVRLYNQGKDAAGSMTVAWARSGAHLALVKASMKHGEWGPYLANNWPYSDRSARLAMQLAELQPDLADLEADEDQVLPEFLANNPLMAPVVEKGIQAVVRASRPQGTSVSRPRLQSGRQIAAVVDGVPVEAEIVGREPTSDPIGHLVSLLPETLTARLREGESEKLAQAFFAEHDSNPPNPAAFALFAEGAVVMDTVLRQREADRGRARRASRVSLEGEQVLAEPESNATSE
jgi:hypothetical protein